MTEEYKPKVGETVEYACLFQDSKIAINIGKWYRGTVIAFHEGYVWTSDNGIRPLSNTKFRPIRSERDIQIDELAKIILDNRNPTVGNINLAGIIYDAGYRKQ